MLATPDARLCDGGTFSGGMLAFGVLLGQRGAQFVQCSSGISASMFSGA